MRRAWRAARMMAGALALSAGLSTLLSGCEYTAMPDPVLSARDRDFIAQVPKADMGRNFERYQVDDPTGQAPGTIVVDTKQKLLYYVLAGGKAVRYGVATGAEAYGWHGTATVKRMAEWPRWMPPADMVKRWPHLKPVVAEGGMPGGPENPLGARALYRYDAGGRDTLYRIHGTNEPTEIGHDASSGCIRMRDIDVIDLYGRAKVGTRVVVM